MKNTEKLNLIEGVFTEVEAREILTNFFKYKINYHKIKNWSSNERYGVDEEFSHRSIHQLENELEKLLLILDEAKKNNKSLSICSEINLVLK